MENGNEFPAQAIKPFDIILLAYMRDEQKGRKSQSRHQMSYTKKNKKIECSELDFQGMWFFVNNILHT